jgi:hypothetical protein
MTVVHQQTESSHGVKTSRCGLQSKHLATSGWQSDVNCPHCLAGTGHPDRVVVDSKA